MSFRWKVLFRQNIFPFGIKRENKSNDYYLRSKEVFVRTAILIPNVNIVP